MITNHMKEVFKKKVVNYRNGKHFMVFYLVNLSIYMVIKNN
jgi:hypothetical protein